MIDSPTWPDRKFADAQAPLDDFEVDQAAGMLTVQLEVDIAIAYTRLRSYALEVERPVRAVAEDVIAHRLHLPATSA